MLLQTWGPCTGTELVSTLGCLLSSAPSRAGRPGFSMLGSGCLQVIPGLGSTGLYANTLGKAGREKSGPKS